MAALIHINERMAALRVLGRGRLLSRGMRRVSSSSAGVLGGLLAILHGVT